MGFIATAFSLLSLVRFSEGTVTAPVGLYEGRRLPSSLTVNVREGGLVDISMATLGFTILDAKNVQYTLSDQVDSKNRNIIELNPVQLAEPLVVANRVMQTFNYGQMEASGIAAVFNANPDDEEYVITVTVNDINRKKILSIAASLTLA